MKKILFLAITTLAFASCSKDEADNNPTLKYAFTEGQKVTISASAGDKLTRATSSYNATDKQIDFKWENGDQVLVTVGGKTATFTLSSGAGTSKATFTGTMPASGSTFDMNYPVTAPDLTSQEYSTTEAIPHGKTTFEATDCDLETTAELNPTNSCLRLNLYGTDKTISKIIVTNKSNDSKYTLNISGGKELGTTAETATPFYIAVPTGEYKISAEIFDNAETPTSICKFTTSGELQFYDNSKDCGQMVNMDAKEVKIAEFSVSATKKVRFTNGNLYYSTTDNAYHIEDEQNVTYATLGQSAYDATHVCHFFWSNITDWQTDGKQPWATYYAFSAQSVDDEFFCGETHKMTVDGQSGLYALTGGDNGEWYYLLNSRTKAKKLREFGVTVATSAGTSENCLIIAPDGYSEEIKESYTADEWAIAESAGLVCLPAAGNRDTENKLADVNTKGIYWSATPSASSVDQANCLHISDESIDSKSVTPVRALGNSVRLVYDAK